VILHIPGIKFYYKNEKTTLIFPISKRFFCSYLPSPALLLLSPTSAKDLKRISAKALDHGRIATEREREREQQD
jgi:hypothetical protein